MGEAAKGTAARVEPSLLREVADLVEQSVADPEAAVPAILKIVIGAARADNGYLILAARRGDAARRRRDPLAGFRIQLYHRAIPLSPKAARLAAEIIRDVGYVDDPVVQARALRRGDPWLERQVPPARSTCSSALVALRDALGHGDELVGGVPFGPDACFHVGLDRARGARRFLDSDRSRALTILSMLTAPLRRVAAWHGVFGGHVLLTPRESQTFRLLLGGGPEKQIAAEMGLSARSTHQLVLATYRKLEVRGRSELFCRWLELAGDPDPRRRTAIRDSQRL